MASRLLTVNLETKYYPASVPTRTITCSNSTIKLTDEEYDEVFKELPSFWNTENDKLVRFIIFDDKSYFCEREKLVFNYTTREQDLKIYRFDAATEVEAKALHAFFVEKYTKIQLARIENLYDAIMSNIKDMSFVKYSLLGARDELLKQSDFIMLPDYPISEEDRERWRVYRQELRDLTDQVAWQQNDLLNIEMPVSPEPLDQIGILKGSIKDLSSIPDNLTDEIIDTLVDKPVEEIIKNITQTTVKFELLKSLSKMNLPMFNIGYSDLLIQEDTYNTFIDNVQKDLSEESPLPANWWELATSNIEEKIAQVNAKLQSYNIGFTVNDILNAVIEQNKLTEEELEVENIIEDL
jgi:hypothetical protein